MGRLEPTSLKLYKVMDNKKNEELQSRREFFKRTLQSVLPVLGVTILSNFFIPKVYAECGGTYFDAINTRTGQCLGCSGTCSGECRGTCSGSCTGSNTQGNLQGNTGCRNNGCYGGCAGGCQGTCYRSCYTGCDGYNYY